MGLQKILKILLVLSVILTSHGLRPNLNLGTNCGLRQSAPQVQRWRRLCLSERKMEQRNGNPSGRANKGPKLHLISCDSSGPTVDSTEAESLKDAVREVLEAENGWPFIPEGARLQVAETVAYRSEITQLRGAAAYHTAKEEWRDELIDLAPDVRTTVLRVNDLGSGKVVVRYNISWVPPKAKGLEALGNSWPGVDVQYVDLLDKVREKSVFKWSNLFRVFWRAITEGVLLVPLAVLLGTVTLSFSRVQEDRWVLMEHRESTDLLGFVLSGELQNRGLAQDLLLFLDSRRPPDLSLDEWNDKVLTEVDIQSVPGMGQFDIDGLEPGEQQEVLAGGVVALGYLTLCVLAVGGAVAAVYLQQVQERRAMEAALDLLLFAAHAAVHSVGA